MKIIRARRPEVTVEYLREYLLPDDDFEEDQLPTILKSALEDRPEETFVLMAIDGDKMKLFLIAFAPERQRHVFLLQVWADPTLEGTSLQDQMFLRLLLWAHDLGRETIRMETKRSPKAFTRRWGFKKVSVVMGYEIGDDFEEKLLSHSQLIDRSDNPEMGLFKEDTDGRIEQTKEHVELRLGNPASGESIVPEYHEGIEDSNGGLSRGSDGPIDSANATSHESDRDLQAGS